MAEFLPCSIWREYVPNKMCKYDVCVRVCTSQHEWNGLYTTMLLPPVTNIHPIYTTPPGPTNIEICLSAWDDMAKAYFRVHEASQF